ncbi:polysaccharide deacetylase family protein [Lutimonas saemankumensis]|uniref:polysaccharide deacetylase family protein n=1 Tax=Lutimonas saemankumensis TaxID=483016 RepID=UPI001CD6F344|nr:polysaccharide deacetylase family protein [Lutimonas saemankumensis]MCA0930994.1 polysaccharide deacetylase family protein [Lutimonas saemankumensis]
MLLVYTHKVTPRLTYIFRHIFVRILHIEVGFTTKIEEFIGHEGPKFSYTKQPLGNELFVKSNELLFTQGIDYVEVNMVNWDDDPCFFQTNFGSIVPCDIFAASFYLISRYEEYLPHVKDLYERFPAAESLAYQNKFLDRPVIDVWAFKFRSILISFFPGYKDDLTSSKRKFNYISTIDIDNAYQFKHKGFTRNVGGILKDLFQFNLANVWMRFLVVFGIRRDPYDMYKWLLAIKKKYKIRTIFFFLLGEYSTYDKNISAGNSNYKLLIKSIADYAEVGIHPSYFSMKNDSKIKKEKQILESIVNFPIKRSRQHYLRIEIPETYQHLVDLEITEEYSMGYASHYGFRASTCTPFYFYDLDFEIQTPLKVFPFAAMDATLKDYLNFTPKRSFNTFMKLAKEVRKVEGTFITIFHNESVSGSGRWRGWGRVYEGLLAELNKVL